VLEEVKTSQLLLAYSFFIFLFYLETDRKTKGTLKGGLDIKYGINDAFTLDAIISDFGEQNSMIKF
jgi:hypothetical protein